jgi:4-amino-4-deoxy-L-arabinose transferase-like glycosyltransferase
MKAMAKLAVSNEPLAGGAAANGERHTRVPKGAVAVLFAAAAVFLANIISPPHLMDDVDAVQAQIARNMLESGNWVSAQLDGVAYLEKSPLIYWTIAASFRLFGVHDWSARLPLALSCMLLCWTVYRFARWAFDEPTGVYAGIVLATCVGLYLFTRIQIPDAMVTLTMTVSLWAGLRLLEEEAHPRRWASLLGAALGLGLLLKGLIAVLFPVLAGLAFLLATRSLFSAITWRRLRLPTVVTVCLLIALPWHVLATLHNPPFFSLAMHSGPGEYHGFFWFYFINEHLLRFLNLRYPRDYNTVPRLWFWLLNLVWLFPWSVYLPGVFRLSYSGKSRADRVHLMAVCWVGAVMLFFTFSTTQEYYSMPIYPALALLIGCVLRDGGRFRAASTKALIGICGLLGLLLFGLLLAVYPLNPAVDISQALKQNPELYTLSLGHMGDLTLRAFAFLKLPLLLAAVAFALAATGLALWRRNIHRVVAVVALSMILFFQASRIALIRFDAYLSSWPLARALQQYGGGTLIEADAYYAFSSVFFYTNRKALLWNGRRDNLEYGSYAPDAPRVFIDDNDLVRLWGGPKLCYLLAFESDLPRLRVLLGSGSLYAVAANSGNILLSNQRVR